MRGGDLVKQSVILTLLVSCALPKKSMVESQTPTKVSPADQLEAKPANVTIKVAATVGMPFIYALESAVPGASSKKFSCSKCAPGMTIGDQNKVTWTPEKEFVGENEFIFVDSLNSANFTSITLIVTVVGDESNSTPTPTSDPATEATPTETPGAAPTEKPKPVLTIDSLQTQFGRVGNPLTFELKAKSSDNSVPEFSCLSCLTGMNVQGNKVTFTPLPAHLGTPTANFLVKAGETSERVTVRFLIKDQLPPRKILTKQEFEYNRTVAFNKNLYEENGSWDVLWDGSSTPADVLENPTLWDSPLDDDWMYPSTTFRFDNLFGTPQKGIFSVDRTFYDLETSAQINSAYVGSNSAAFQGFAGYLCTRDHLFSYKDGITIEFMIHVDNATSKSPEGVGLLFVDEMNSFGVYIAPDHVRLSIASVTAIDAPSVVKPLIFNQTSAKQFRLFRITKAPSSDLVKVYVDGALLLEGNADPSYYSNKKITPTAGSNTLPLMYLRFPILQIGDLAAGSWQVPTKENPNGHYSPGYHVQGKFALDFIRYRRGAFAPADTLPQVSARPQPPMPPAAVKSTESLTWNEFPLVSHTSECEKNRSPACQKYQSFPFHHPANVGAYLNSKVPAANRQDNSCYFPSDLLPCYNVGNWYAWKTDSPDAMEYVGDKTGGTIRVFNAPHLYDNGAFTFEVTLKVAGDHQDGGFSLGFEDNTGSTKLTFGTDYVEMFMMGNVGHRKIVMDTTDEFHTYRIVRSANSLYAHLYIDNEPYPSISDMKIAWEKPRNAIDGQTEIYMGFLSRPVFKASEALGHVYISKARWHPYAWAPPPELSK